MHINLASILLKVYFTENAVVFAYQSLSTCSQNILSLGCEQGCLRCVHRAQATDGAAVTSGTRNNEGPSQQIPTRADKKIVSFL